jgi:hypothetical protein
MAMANKSLEVIAKKLSIASVNPTEYNATSLDFGNPKITKNTNTDISFELPLTATFKLNMFGKKAESLPDDLKNWIHYMNYGYGEVQYTAADKITSLLSDLYKMSDSEIYVKTDVYLEDTIFTGKGYHLIATAKILWKVSMNNGDRGSWEAVQPGGSQLVDSNDIVSMARDLIIASY